MVYLDTLIIIALLVVLAFALRRRVLLRGVGAVEMSMRIGGGFRTRGWAPGIGWYAGHDLSWYRVFSLSPRPACRVSRHQLVVAIRRAPAAGEITAVPAGAVILECQTAAGTQEIAMTREAETGFLAWLDSQPPGYHRAG